MDNKERIEQDADDYSEEFELGRGLLRQGYIAGRQAEQGWFRGLIRTYHQTLIARFYNEKSFDKNSLSKIIDEIETLLK